MCERRRNTETCNATSVGSMAPGVPCVAGGAHVAYGTKAGNKVGTHASAVCRLEDNNYEGHSLAMLRRIAAVLNKGVQIRFVAVKPERPAPKAERRKRGARE